LLEKKQHRHVYEQYYKQQQKIKHRKINKIH